VNPFPMGTGVKVWLSTGYTDMRCGFPSLALRVQEVLQHDPLSGIRPVSTTGSSKVTSA
jgi:transposase